MIILNKLILNSKDEQSIDEINRLIRNEKGEVDLNITVEMPDEIIDFSLDHINRFDHIIKELKVYKENKDEDAIEELKLECNKFLSHEEWRWIEVATNLTLKFGAYDPVSYFKLKTGVIENAKITGSEYKNTRKIFSFYTKDQPALTWARDLSKQYPTVKMELHYKEKSQLKYRKIQLS